MGFVFLAALVPFAWAHAVAIAPALVPPRRGVRFSSAGDLARSRASPQAGLAVLARCRFFIRQALSALVRSLGITVLSVATIGVALTVLATFFLVVKNLSRVADRLGQAVELSAYLGPSVAAESLSRTQDAIRGFDEVRDLRYVTSNEAMEELRASLGKDAVVLEGLPGDLLPASLEIRLDARAWTTSDVRLVADRISRLEGVEDVRFGQEEIERVQALLSFARIAAVILGAALCFATVLIISNTIRLTVYARRDEIEIMSLVGATNAFVRAPFVIEGAIQGVLGGTMALLGLSLLEGGLKVGIERGLNYAYGPIQLDFAPTELFGHLLLAGLALGLVGSVLAVGKFLKV